MARYTILKEKEERDFGGKKSFWIRLETENREHSYEQYVELEEFELECEEVCLQKLADQWELANYTVFPKPDETI